MVDYKKLVAEAKKKNNDAITELYQDTYREAIFIARQTLRNQDDAEDVVQDAYIKAFKSLDMLKEPDKFKAWLNRIVTNKSLDYLKKKKPALFTDMPVQIQDKEELDFESALYNETEEYNPEDMMDKQAMVEIFDEIFASLSPEQRVCVILYYREQMSIAEIAETLQVSEGTVKSRLNYARKYVRAQVEAYEKDGLKLYSGMPIILWVLRNHGGEEIAAPDTLLSNILSSIGTMGTTSSASIGSTAAVGTKTTIVGKTVASTGLAAIKTKVIAGVLAAAVAVGGGTVAVKEISHQNEIKNAKEAYESLMASRVYAGEIDRNYYTFLDLDQNEIPELLVTDEVRPIWTDYEYYRYRDGEVYKEEYGSNYAGTFYIANDTALVTSSRVWGNTYMTLGENGIQIEAYTKTNRDLTTGENLYLTTGDINSWKYYRMTTTEANYENLLAEEITESEYQHFNNTDEGVIENDGYVKTLEMVVFEKNTYRDDVEANEQELINLLGVAEVFRNDAGDAIVDECDFTSAAAWYGTEWNADSYFFPARIENIDSAGYEVLVYKREDVEEFFKDTVGLNDYIKLPEYTGDINWNDDWYVYELDDEIYIVLDGIGGWSPSDAKMLSYHENGDGTATAVFECKRWYDGEIFNAKLTVQRNDRGGLQIKEYKGE